MSIFTKIFSRLLLFSIGIVGSSLPVLEQTIPGTVFRGFTKTADGGHQEVVSGLTVLPGQGQVVATVFDPFTNFQAAGALYFDKLTGTSPQYQALTQDGGLPAAQRAATFGKAANLGDLEIFCNNAPIEIGNRAWVNANDNAFSIRAKLHSLA
ncbi:hypothetical protein EXU85_29275 [Spirosoma sp. KCTC 42546]|uniref:hypothetical protein n=1 Tax=Spirosoma sp. KCTC 42546 TaxID=2520506 RepID=UPI00115AEFDA|nr:hypothetical protein [Spirosoma sp. KCTC 42546]QDK82477.1 hypothetical protein EXU85_29275 [Spirosoma sp. KCTC 42546]